MGLRTSTVTETKTANEQRQLTMDFSGLMATAETITSIDSTKVYLNDVLVAQGAVAEPGATNPVLIASAAVSGQTVLLMTDSGVSGSVYKVVTKITTSGSQELEGAGISRIGDA